MTDDMLLQDIICAVQEHMQLLAHCNGDAACAQYLQCVQKAAGQGLNVKAIRPVVIHAQLIGRDQLADAKRLGLLLSFFVAHVYYWGDVHIRNFGLSRAKYISPALSAQKAGHPLYLPSRFARIAPRHAQNRVVRGKAPNPGGGDIGRRGSLKRATTL